MAASYIEALLPAPFDTGGAGIRDFRWNNDDPLGSPVTVEFKFLTAAPNHAGADGTGFLALTDAQKTAARTILGLYEEICKIDFVEVGAGANADILFGRNNQSPVGYAYVPELLPSADPVDGGPGGDIWISKIPAANQDVDPGEPGWQTLIHEIGHALGLKHPFEPDGAQPVLPNATENVQYTVMSYTEHPFGQWRTVTDTGGGGFTSEYFYIQPSTPMLYDIAAIQHLYGKNMTTRTGNNTYTFDPDTPFLKCIWDAGGKDTISVSNFTLGCEIDLRDGRFSSITILPEPLPFGPDDDVLYDGTDNLSIAFGAKIENATGGSGHDTLTGNTLANALVGNAGNDTLNGGEGNDNLNGGAGADNLQGGTGNDILIWQASDTKINGGAGTDTLKVASGNLNLTTVSNAKIVNIETINMTGSNNNTLTLKAADILAISSTTDTLKVFGNLGDRVDIQGAFSDLGVTGGFHKYQSGAAVLLVDTDIIVV